MADFFPELLCRFTEAAFLEKVCKKFHYGQTRIKELRDVAEEMLPFINREAFWESKEYSLWKEQAGQDSDTKYENVVMSLGAGIDKLQEDYHAKGLLSESYMLEVLAGELLLTGYGFYNRYVKEKGKWHVARYHFPGSEAAFPLSMMPELLKKFGGRVACNDAFCLIPKKSVVMIAELTQDEEVNCESICTGCHNLHCPNRVTEDRNADMMAKLPDMPLSYGYRRIFGKL